MPVSIVLSFDDGFKTDVKLASILERYHARATFFIIANKINSHTLWLSSEDLQWLSDAHEIGSHTLSHPNLVGLPERELVRELRDSKLLLERVINKRIVGFAYPYSIFSEHVKKYAREAGYRYARSTNAYWIGVDGQVRDPYSLRVTLPLYPLKLIGSIWDAINKLRPVFLRAYMDMFLKDVRGFFLKAARRGYIDTFTFAKDIILTLLELSRESKRSYIISLWGHSWEIVHDRDAKSRFEDLLAFISSLGGHVRVLTFKEILNNLRT